MRKLVQQQRTDVTSFCMQFEKEDINMKYPSRVDFIIKGEGGGVGQMNESKYLDGIRTHRSRVIPLMKRALYLQATTAGLKQGLAYMYYITM